MLTLRMQPQNREATFKNSTSSLYQMHQFVRDAAVDFGFSNVALGDIELAIVEASANIVKHSYRLAGESALIELRVQMHGTTFRVSFRDYGEPFTPPTAAVRAPDVTSMIAEGRRGGMGLFFMYALMDEIQWNIRPGVYNELTMVKYLES